MSGPIQSAPFVGSPERQHFEFLRQGEFRLQTCKSCSLAIFYPRTLCPHCGGLDLEWRPSAGHGVVYSATIVRQPARLGGDYNVVLVDLDEGVRLMSRIVGIACEEVRIGMRVKAEILSPEEGDPLLVFRAEEQNHDR